MLWFSLTFVKLAGTLNKIYDTLIFSYAILITSAVIQSEGKGVSIPKPM